MNSKRNARQARYRKTGRKSRMDIMITPETKELYENLSGLEKVTHDVRLKRLCQVWEKYVKEHPEELEQNHWETLISDLEQFDHMLSRQD